jgi:hypothetical protein
MYVKIAGECNVIPSCIYVTYVYKWLSDILKCLYKQSFRSNTFISRGELQTIIIFVTSMITKSTEQKPSWEANSHSNGQEIPSLLWNLKVHYRVYKSPILVHVLEKLNAAHAFPPHFSQIHFNTTLSSTTSYYLQALRPNIVCIPHFYMAHPNHPSCFDHLKIFGCCMFRELDPLACSDLERTCETLIPVKHLSRIPWTVDRPIPKPLPTESTTHTRTQAGIHSYIDRGLKPQS